MSLVQPDSGSQWHWGCTRLTLSIAAQTSDIVVVLQGLLVEYHLNEYASEAYRQAGSAGGRTLRCSLAFFCLVSRGGCPMASHQSCVL